ncbi:RNA helicase [Candidatus Wolfebacteria bacterium CG10_big_fil_rev_8_21_14_0_10_31_9]|uniref:RNA helicase n=1 Tax=Candidatus Wolfebacteria bacterium CG10_big_fil_rev_8_21_14_0_10_31_9 TaxID=1975070 RepID=A0A2H0RCR6_9BACT|nr:MAG: RNA helicase [Candidatus Wolfebacteria bacterium CG10_big_fil_rev_8_21_14_0_10_31_9]
MRQTNKKRVFPGSTGSFSRFGLSRPSSGRNFSRRNRSSGKSSFIDESKFINKASEQNVMKYISKHKFVDFKIDERLKQNIIKKGFIHPTAIQDQTIPEILNGKDIIGLADTGTGKTAAFLVPFINKVILNKNHKVLIMAPTRELAIQINAEFAEFARSLGIFSVVAVGGESIGRQISQLRRSHNFLIGTPGRLKDLSKRKFVNFNSFGSVILDEADRMLDMGFIDDMKFILDQLPKERQTLLFSATLSKDTESLTHRFLNNPLKIQTKLRDTSSNVDQDVIRINSNEEKIEALHNLLIEKDFKKVLIFVKTKIGADKLERALGEKGFKVTSIHGDKRQSNRQRALKLFKEDQIQILVATDVAARGLDIPEVSHVINFDIPATYDDYIHRIGRTGRAYNKGIALTFVSGIKKQPSKSFSGNKGIRRFSAPTYNRRNY